MEACFLIAISLLGITSPLLAQDEDLLKQEAEYYHIVTLPIPQDVSMEVGGLCALPDGRLAACTRKGDVWLIENPEMRDRSLPRYTLFAEGLHEPLGMAYHQNSILVTQRGELTRLTDRNGDDKADRFEMIYNWPLSGNYHEYSYGPRFLPDGSMIITLNVAFPGGKSHVPWRGWALQIFPDGHMEPWACGLRSPCGTGTYEGEFFYTDNQGGWVGSGGIWHVQKGRFMGQPESLNWTSLPESPIDLTPEAFHATIEKLQNEPSSQPAAENNPQNGKSPVLLARFQEEVPALQMPAVWLPHGILGISNTDILVDQNEGKFGPFEGQLFIGDQGQSKIMRVVLEKVKGEYQGVAFDFRAGFQSGILRMIWAEDGSIYMGQTNRGWGSAGGKDEGLQRLVWSGKTPFEMQNVRAKADGFEIEFTKPIDVGRAEDLDSYSGRSFTYKYHKQYGSPIINQKPLAIKGVKVSEDRMKVRLVVENLREHYIHEIRVDGIRTADSSLTVLHPAAYYTLHHIPEGDTLPTSALSTKSSSKIEAARQAAVDRKRQRTQARERTRPRINAVAVAQTTVAPTYAEVKPLLVKHTCTACHQTNKKVVGPPFKAVAKRNYTPEQIVELIYKPVPANWPEYATPMAPMPHVPREDALKIARWINSLD